MKFGEKISNIIKKEFNSKPVHKKKLHKLKKSTQKKYFSVFIPSNIDSFILSKR